METTRKLTALELFTIERRIRPHRFPVVSCSQCGRDQGSGNFGFSHCSNHRREQTNRARAEKKIANPLN